MYTKQQANQLHFRLFQFHTCIENTLKKHQNIQ